MVGESISEEWDTLAVLAHGSDVGQPPLGATICGRCKQSRPQEILIYADAPLDSLLRFLNPLAILQ
jgi:hypothetical protein